MGKKIDAEELYHRMYEEAFEKDSDLQKWDSGCWIRFKLFENVLKDMPEIEVEEKTGHWIRITNGAIREKYTCSECGRQIEDCGIENLLPIKYPYCHCGAKMEGE